MNGYRSLVRLSRVAMVLLLVVSSGCVGRKPTPTLTPTPTPTAAPTVQLATAVPAATPTATVRPLATPLPLGAPKVLRASPERGEELPTSGPVVVRFDQPMDVPSTERAFGIEPAVAGSFTWDDARTLRFAPPSSGLLRNADYRVTITNTALSSNRLPLARPFELRFRTVGPLLVSDAFPLPDSTGVSTKAALRIAFNRPVVPLTAIQAQAAFTNPLVITPDLPGKASWTNTSIFTFEPTSGLQPGTKYAVRVRAGLQDTTGAVLAEDYVWSFSTDMPSVSFVSPANNATLVSPHTGIRAGFNQPMQAESAQSRFSLVKDKATTSTPGRFTWIANTLVFTPTQPLELGALYHVYVDKGALAASGTASTQQATHTQFQVAGIPSVVAFTPRDGDTAADPYRGLQITFSSPISRATFAQALTITPRSTLYVWWGENDTRANVSVYLEPSTRYTVTLNTSLLGRYGGNLQQSRVVRFTTKPASAFVQPSAGDRTASYSAYSTPVLYGTCRNVSRVLVSLYSLPLEDMVRLNSEDGWRLWNEYRPPVERLVRNWALDASAPLNASRGFSVTLTAQDGARLKPGFYYLTMGSPEVSNVTRQMMLISDTNLTLKSSSDEAFVWATDMRDALPLPGIALAVYDRKGIKVAEVATDRDGVAKARIPRHDSWAPMIIVARRGDGLSAVVSGWSNGVERYDFHLTPDYASQTYLGYLYTDRRIYRPGQTVYYKGILRQDDDARYSLPPVGVPISVTVSDDEGREVWRGNHTLSDMGTFDGEFVLSESAGLGYYGLRARSGEQWFSADFQVAEYRKPEFQAQVTLDKEDYVQGDSIRALAEASYYFGGPLVNAPVTWRVMRTPYAFDRYQGKGYYSFSDWDEEDQWGRPSYGELYIEGQGVTDAEGRLSFTIPANIAAFKQSQTFVVEASVTDVSNQEVSARSSTIIHKGSYYIGLAPTSYVGSAGQRQSVQAITVDTQGLSVTQKLMEVVFYRREWFSVREQQGDDSYYWVSKPRDTAVATETVKTDQNGQVLVSFVPPQGGTYRVVARGRDERENEVRSAAFMWVSDRTFISWRQENNDRVELVADKKSYRPGETAQILIPSPYQGTTRALLTIERGRVLEHRLLELKTNSELLSLPILPEYAPDVFVSVVIVKAVDTANPVPSFKVGYVKLSVSSEQKELKVSIVPDRSGAYRPRDKAVYQVQVSDYAGRPAQAELSLQLVDLAVEALTGGDTRSIMDVFYYERGLGVQTASILTIAQDRKVLEAARAGGKGGGGGDIGEGTVRKRFADTAFWAPAVRTDANGRARVTVDLPDNLTTWRMTGQAVTADTSVGKQTSEIVTNLDVMVRPVTPRFMVIGDRPVLAAAVHNNTKKALDLSVSLEAVGVAVTNASQPLSVPAGELKTVSWPCTVGLTDEASLLFTATGGGYSDAVELRLPVYHQSSPETVGTAGEVDDRIVEQVQLPMEADLSLGELRVQLEPSLAAGMRDGLRFLETYPYDCIEQTVSRFLPNVITYRALKDLGIRNAELEAKLPQQVGAGLQRLYALQGLDGGWGWWRTEPSQPVLTAYALIGLAQARKAQFSVDKRVVERAVAYLYEYLDAKRADTPQERDRRASVLYALAEAGQGDLARTIVLFEKRASMSVYAKGYLALALRLLEPKEPSRQTALVNDLLGAALMSATGAHWEEAQFAGWAMNTDTRTTAIALRALVGLQPQSSLLPNAVRWLMLARREGRWETTQENVYVIWALTDYMVSTGELLADYDLSLTINGIQQATGTVNADNVAKPVLSTVPVTALRRDANNDVVIDRITKAGQKGTGKLYYTAFLRYYLPAERLKPLNRGIVVDRQYYLGTDTKTPISGAKVNDVLTVKLTLIAPNDLYFLILEDPLPAGCEAIDTSLRTSSISIEGPQLDQAPEGVDQWRRYGYWFSHSDLRDEKVALFASTLPRGTYEYTYQVRCTTPGVFKVMPAVASEMYFADVFGRSGGAVFTVAQ